MFQRNGWGAQKRALEAIRMKASTFRMAKKNNALRLRDLLGILEALGEDPATFFQEISEKIDPPSVLEFFLPISDTRSTSEVAELCTLVSLDEQRFDEPVSVLGALFELTVSSANQSRREGVLGSCFRFLDLYSDAERHLRAAVASATMAHDLADALSRSAWLYFLDSPNRALGLLDRAGFTFVNTQDWSRFGCTLTDKAIVAFHAGDLTGCITVCHQSMDFPLPDRYRTAAAQLTGLAELQGGNASAARHWFEQAVDASAKLTDRYTKGSLIWSFAKVEDDQCADELFDRAIELFGHQLIFHAVTCGLEKLERGLGDPEETLTVLCAMCELSPLPRLGDILEDYLARIQLPRRRDSGLVEVYKAVRRIWERWRTAQVSLLRSTRRG